MHHSKHLIRGSCLMLLAMLCFSISGAFIKLIGVDVPTSVSLFFRFVFNLIFLLPFLISDINKVVKTHFLNRIILRSLIGFIALACMFYAIKYMTLANAILLNNTSTLFIPIIVFIATRIKTSFKVVGGVILGFIGVVFVLGPKQDIFNLISIIGLASGLFGGVALVLTRDIAKAIHPNQIIFYYSLFGALVSLIFSLFQINPYPQQIWIYLCGVGIFGALYQVFLTYALKFAKVRYISSLSFFSFIFAAIFDWLIWNKIPDSRAVIGMILVIIGGFMTIYFGAKSDRIDGQAVK